MIKWFFTSRRGPHLLEPTQISNELQDLIARLNRLRIEFERALCGD
jgi:hypothetical protein